MIQPFSFYLQRNLVRKTTPNKSMARALASKARIRFQKIERQKIFPEEVSLTFEDVYESIREGAQALMELKGYKPYSHEALIAFLKEENFLDEASINTFDRYRVLRNDSVYKTVEVSLERCNEAITYAKKTVPQLQKKTEELLNNS